MAKQAYVYSGTDWVPLASEVTNLSGYQTKALNQFAHRNLLINGDMQVHQRGTSVASITTDGYRTADRWYTEIGNSSLGTWTQSVENDAPTGSGFRKSLKMLCTTADASPAASDYILVQQRIEGQNLQQVKKGTAAAEQLTVSFWVKSNVTGTYNVALYDVDNSGRAQSRTYTVSASATWEYKTLTFSADTTGALDNDNARSLDLSFWLGVGSNFTSGTANPADWNTTVGNLAPGQVNVGAATNNYWQITGVQLEVGATATPFEFKTVEDELLECQRYYYRNTPGTAYGSQGLAQVRSTTQTQPTIYFPTTMRATPTTVEFSNIGIERAGIGIYAITAMTIQDSGPNVMQLGATNSTSGAAAGDCVNVLNNNSTAGYLGFNAEL